MPTLSDHSDQSSHGDEEDEYENQKVDLNSIDSDADRRSDDENPDQDSEGESDESDQEGRRFFDMEALESDESEGETDGDDGDGDGNEHDHNEEEDVGNEEPRFFPQFTRLPIEIRMKIWEAFCPDLTANGRVYEPATNENPMAQLILVNQTLPIRTVLAVHRESREFVLRVFPHTLVLEDKLFLRFNREKDIVSLPQTGIGSLIAIPGFTDEISNLAISPHWFDFQSEIPRPGSSTIFPRLKNVFFITDHSDFSSLRLRWCATVMANYSPMTTVPDTLDGTIGESYYQELYVWPDLEKHRQDAECEIPLHRMWRAAHLPEYEGKLVDGPGSPGSPSSWASDSKYLKNAVAKQLAKLPIWPLVQFNSAGIPRLERLQAWSGAEEDWEESSGFTGSEPEEEELNEYESSGIDDGEMDEDDLMESEDEFQFLAPDDDNDEDREPSGFEGFSPVNQNGHVTLMEDGEVPHARFSSPEPDSATIGAESDGAGSDEPTARRNTRRRKRIVESDDEETEDEAPRKRARQSGRVESDEEGSDKEESEDEAPRKRQRRTALPEDSEDEDDLMAEDDESGDGSEDEDESEEESEEDSPQARPMSLAEKLQLHRDQNPVPGSDHDEDDNRDSDMDGGSDGGYEAPDYHDFQDDEEGNEGFDVDEANGGFAAEFDENEENEEDEEYGY